MTSRAIKSKLVFVAVMLMSAAAVATTPRFMVTVVGEGVTVADGATNLVWQQVSDSGPLDWKDALAHCENLNYAGQADWRLPNVTELTTLVDDKAELSPAINTVYFAGFDPGSGYWTSTSSRKSFSSAYVLYFNEQNSTVGRGGVSALSKTTNARALCVRGGLD